MKRKNKTRLIKLNDDFHHQMKENKIKKKKTENINKEQVLILIITNEKEMNS